MTRKERGKPSSSGQCDAEARTRADQKNWRTRWTWPLYIAGKRKLEIRITDFDQPPRTRSGILDLFDPGLRTLSCVVLSDCLFVVTLLAAGRQRLFASILTDDA